VNDKRHKVRFTAEERDALLTHFALPGELRGDLRQSLSSVVPIGVDEADELREQAEELLLAEGFDQHYRPTAFGKILESLIDKLLIA
jgi:hypothetical protein